MNNVIWSNDLEMLESIQKDLILMNDGMDEETARDRAYDENNEDLESERVNLDIHVGQDIIIIADLGLWDGRHQAYKEVKSDNIRDCLSGTTGDYVTWYVDDLGDLRCDDVHHDGTNHYMYRSWKPGISWTQKDNFLYKVYEGKATRADITRYTERLGDHIAKVYGWELRGKKNA